MNRKVLFVSLGLFVATVFVLVVTYIVVPELAPGFVIKAFRSYEQNNIITKIKQGNYEKNDGEILDVQRICFIWGRMNKRGTLVYNPNDKVIAECIKAKMQINSSDDLIMYDDYVMTNLR